MGTMITVDGIPLEVVNPDLDGDGQIGREKLTAAHDSQLQPIMNSTELGDSLKEYHLDTVDIANKSSSVTSRGNIHPMEEGFILRWNALVFIGFLPYDRLDLTREKLRLTKSRYGKALNDTVTMTTGKMDRNKQDSVLDKAKQITGFGNKDDR